MSIADSLTNLDAKRDALAANLNTMGVTAAESETMKDLIAKVLDIEGGTPSTSAEVLIVAGGGGGGGEIGGGGGGGGLLHLQNIHLARNTYPIVVGTGGAGVATVGNGSRDDRGKSGNDSTAFGYTALGGGGGGCNNSTGTYAKGKDGGSGGGAGQNYVDGVYLYGGTHQTGAYGFDGGRAIDNSPAYGSGGGGGAGGAGANGTTAAGGNGGSGYACSITGTSAYYAAGGGGAAYSGTAGTGGSSIGGSGALLSPITAATAGAANTGSGGGGNNQTQATGNGADGVVIIRYKTSDISATGGTMTTDGDYTVHKFTTSGNFIVT